MIKIFPLDYSCGKIFINEVIIFKKSFMIPIELYKDFQKRNIESFTQNNTKIPQLDLLHSVVGLCEEFLELENAKDEEHKIEELGDLLFYHTVLSFMLNIEPEEIMAPKIMSEQEITKDRLVGLMLGSIKKYIFHGKPIYKDTFVTYLFEILKFSNIENFDIPYVMNYNTDKLRKRYPNGRADNIFNKLHSLTLNII